MHRLRTNEDGFSLMELVVAMAMGSIVLTACMMLFITGITGAARVNDRVEAQQRASIAMDRVTTLLSSQVCLDASTPPILAGSTANSVTFYADLNGASNQPKKYRFTYDPSTMKLTEYQWTGSGSLPSITYPTNPTLTRVLASNVIPASVPSTGAILPVFSYFDFESDGTVDVTAPVTVGGSGVTAAQAAGIVQVNVAFEVRPDRTSSDDPRATTITGQALAGSADPSSPSAGPNCQ
jgi:prepilin-type N-terminal cleavage/methylation domain-containing protein